MKAWIRKLIIWALGFEPAQDYPWEYLIEGEDQFHTMHLNQFSMPPKLLKRPMVECGTYKHGDLPTMAEIETLVMVSWSRNTKTALYKIAQ